MSNRTCFEVNHDLTGEIRRKPVAFADAMVSYLNSASPESAAELSKFGFTRLGIRHHSEPFKVEWGCYSACEQ